MKASILSSSSYNRTTSKGLRTSGAQIKEDYPGDNGKPAEQIYRLQRILTFYRGRNACKTGKFQLKKERTYFDGVIRLQESFKSRKLTTFK